LKSIAIAGPQKIEMNKPPDTAPAQPRDAATVIILRDSPQGLEVFLVRRHGLSEVLGGAYVFPGGKLDASDMALDPTAHLDQPDGLLQAALAEPQLLPAQARGLYVAALREAFEECGVLFAHQGQRSHSLQIAEQLRAGQAFNDVLGALALRLQTRAVLPWSRWITPHSPAVSRKRFDTRFFVAALPPSQVAAHDNIETTDGVWLSPRASLQQYWDRSMEMAAPQIMTLAHLSRFEWVEQVLQAARQSRPPLVEPLPVNDHGEQALCYPGDPCHSVATRAMPGPTRLLLRNQRFEPAQGFEALFA
jgi:8-oxo-dGTP pyrophosphatase MutT (NUDIX family)